MKGIIGQIYNVRSNKRLFVSVLGVPYEEWVIIERQLLDGNAHLNTHLQRSWNKWGRFAFKFSIKEGNVDAKELDAIKKELVRKEETWRGEFGYNHEHYSEMSRKKISKGDL